MSNSPTGTALIANLGRFDSLFEKAEDAAFALDRRTRTVLACNPAVTRMFGYPVHEVVGKTMKLVLASDAEFERFERAVLAAESSGAHARKFRMLRRQGAAFPTSHRIVPIRMHEGGSVLVSFVRDESERQDPEAETDSALSELIRRVDDAPDCQHALAAILETIRLRYGWDYGEARTQFHGDALEVVAASFDRTSVLRRFWEISRIVNFQLGEGVVGRVWNNEEHEWLPDLTGVPPQTVARIASALMLGLRSCFAVFIRCEEERIPVVLFFASREPRAADEKLIAETKAMLHALAGPLHRKLMATSTTADPTAISATPTRAPSIQADRIAWGLPVLALTSASESGSGAGTNAPKWSQFERLTPREGEVLARIMLGESNKLIARSLGISHRTVEAHRRAIWKKLQVHSLNELLINYMSSIE